jgi:predicted porin
MQKKLLTVAIGAVLTAPVIAAQADVTVYGRAQFEFTQVKNDGYFNYPTANYPGGNWNNGNRVQGNNSAGAGQTRTGTLDNKMGRFGIKATEDLGGGWTGLATFEWQVDTADGLDGANSKVGNSKNTGTTNVAGNTLSDRVTFVGISQKSIGTLRFGQDHSPYKVSGVPLDPFIATNLEARNNGGMSGNRDGSSVGNGHSSFWQDSMFFNSASWAGVYVNAAIGLDRTGSTGTCISFSTCDVASTTNGKNNGDLSAVVGWKGNLGPVGLNVFGGYMKLKNMNQPSTAGDPEAKKLGVQVTVAKAHTISLQMEQTDRKDIVGFGSDLSQADYMFIGYQGKFGPVTAVVQYGTHDTGTFLFSGYETKYLAVGAIYNMSKTFRIFGGMRKTESDWVIGNLVPNRDEQVLTIGMRKDF